MSEPRFNLRRPQAEPAADVESYIDHGASAPPQEETPADEPPEKIRRLVDFCPTAPIANSSSWPRPRKQPCPTSAAPGSKKRLKDTSISCLEEEHRFRVALFDPTLFASGASQVVDLRGPEVRPRLVTCSASQTPL